MSSEGRQKDGRKELIDRIGNALPEDVRADFFREMMYCRSLPEDDELLRVIRVMQFLTLLMEGVPGRVAAEREQLEQLFASTSLFLKQALESTKAYQQQLDERLIRLPETIAMGIRPEAIAAEINESLRQQFVLSTIPDTATALGLIAKKMKEASAEFSTTADTLGNSYRGIAQQARDAINSINASVSQAADTASLAAKKLSVNFHRAFWWSMCGLTGGALLIGCLLGMLVERRLYPPRERIVERVITMPEPQPADHAKPGRRKRP